MRRSPLTYLIYLSAFVLLTVINPWRGDCDTGQPTHKVSPQLELPDGATLQSDEGRPETKSAVDAEAQGDANRTRYLYSPSGFSLKEGEAYLSQKELFFTSFAYGVTDHFTVLIGGIVPAWLLEGYNIIVGGKYSFELSERLRLAVGGEAFFFDGLSVGTLFAGFTYGGESAHITLNVGKPVMLHGDSTKFGTSLFSVSANVEMASFLRVITENWLLPDEFSGLIHINGLGVRFQGGSLACDTAMILLGRNGAFEPLPLPWLDFTYNF